MFSQISVAAVGVGIGARYMGRIHGADGQLVYQTRAYHFAGTAEGDARCTSRVLGIPVHPRPDVAPDIMTELEIVDDCPSCLGTGDFCMNGEELPCIQCKGYGIC